MGGDADERHTDAGPWHAAGAVRPWLALPGPGGLLPDGKPHRIEAFGGQLVVWQDTQGNLNVLDGYCRHMGGDLTQGTVKGDEIACPFHDWRWGGDGKCKQIPYARRVPLRARTVKYPAVIRNDQLLVWHDVEGSEPDHDILPPELPGVADGLYTDWTLGGRADLRLPLPRADRQRRGHGALLLRALLVPDQLPQRLRGHPGHAVHGVEGPAGQGRRLRHARTCSSSPRRRTTDRRT